GVARAPVRARAQPHRKGLGEILVGVALRVPEAQMLDEIPAGRIRPVIARIALRGGTEQLLPAAAALQRMRVLHPGAGLVTKDRHAFRPAATLDVDDLFFLELHQPGMRQIERKGDAGRILGAEPFARDPGMRSHPDATLIELIEQGVEAVLEPGALNRDLQIPQPKLEQLLVRERSPGKSPAPHCALGHPPEKEQHACQNDAHRNVKQNVSSACIVRGCGLTVKSAAAGPRDLISASWSEYRSAES